jgi:hypothetical protein
MRCAHSVHVFHLTLQHVARPGAVDQALTSSSPGLATYSDSARARNHLRTRGGRARTGAVNREIR